MRDWDAHLLELYGEYTHSDALAVRAGKLLAPFGIYNDVRYITPLYATVVLPFLYETPANYSGTPLTPPSAVAMVSGRYWGDKWGLQYAACVGTEHKGERSFDPSDIGASVGGRMRLMYNDNLSFGASAYTVEDQRTRVLALGTVMGSPTVATMPFESPREVTWGADFEYQFLEHFRFQAEFVYPDFENLGYRYSYYGRLVYEVGRWTPFVMYDSYRDVDDPVYRATGNRYGAGVGYRISKNFYVKGEYHYHDFTHDDRLRSGMSSADDVSHMFRLSFITAF